MSTPSNIESAFLCELQLRDETFKRSQQYPFNLPWLENFQLEFRSPVTFFVGENGSGKSTLIEALATLCGLPTSGGSRQEAASFGEQENRSRLAKELSPAFKKRPRDGFFFRAESYAKFANLLDARQHDPDFAGFSPLKNYGGRSLNTRSHGESFLALMQNRLQRGLFLMDEPESALSPQRQLSLLSLIASRVATNESQFIIATHSPIMLTYPGAQIIDFDNNTLCPISIEETSHYQITRGILERPQSYWKHLVGSSDPKE